MPWRMLLWLFAVSKHVSYISREDCVIAENAGHAGHAAGVYRKVYYTTYTGLIDNRYSTLYAAHFARDAVYYVMRLTGKTC
jgi:hypothetical protein